MGQIRTSHSLSERVLEIAGEIQDIDSRPSMSNTLEMLIKRGIDSWLVDNGDKYIKATKKKKKEVR